MTGYTASKNPMNVYAIRVHYSADEDKNPRHPDPEKSQKATQWLASQKELYPDPNDFQRELEISWYVGKGSRVFPQYTDLHRKPLTFNRYRVIYRAWDFGWHAPACVWAQIDGHDRLCLLKEYVGRKQDTKDFAQQVVKLSNDWFPTHVPGFEDFCDPAGQQIKSIESEKSERRDIDILHSQGIYPKYEFGWSRKDGRTIVHQLLNLRTDETPGLYVDPSGCPILDQSFLGRYVYPETQAGKIKDEPNDDEHPWGDIMAALRYLVTGLHLKLVPGRFRASQINQRMADPDYHGYGTKKR